MASSMIPSSANTANQFGLRRHLIQVASSNVPLPGIDGVLLLVVIGDGKLIIPLDFAIRRPNPQAPVPAMPRQLTGDPEHAR